MPTSPYLLHVNSRPTLVSPSTWTSWYTTEHLPDLVNSHASTRATFYNEISAPPSTPSSTPAESSDNPKPFLALYQSDHEEPLKSEGYVKDVRKDSEIFREASGKSVNQANGEFDARNYKLVQDFDPRGLRDVTSPHIVTVEMNAKNEDDFHAWYHKEHLDLLSKVPGYRKSSRYVIGPATPLTLGEPAKFLAIHELDHLDGLAGLEAKAANETEWTTRMIAESKPFVVRMWGLVHGEGAWK